jgi:alpha-D-ribose 1-methylphosphonate 5-triphosphate synthase subunit PhnL
MTERLEPVLSVSCLSKGFTLHLHGGKELPVIEDASFDLYPGECLVLGGPSGAGKSSVLKMIYGNYLSGAGSILIRHQNEVIDLVNADTRTILAVRRHTLGYVSQFLRVIPRVPTLDIVSEPALAAGLTLNDARARAAALLTMLNLPERLWSSRRRLSRAVSSSASISPGVLPETTGC